VSDVQRDPRFAQDTATRTGYVPRSILAMPLLAGERVIGVIEVLDKLAAPSFGLQDMELLGLFAQQAALAIHQSAQVEHLGQALVKGLSELAAGPEQAALRDALTRAQRDAQGSEEAGDLLALAEVLREISALGHAELSACLRVLEAFGEYARRRADVTFGPTADEGLTR
jgi:GAF domain-containing protein